LGNGTFVATWGNTGTLDGLFNSPVSVAVDALGSVYVVDSGNNRIEVFVPVSTGPAFSGGGSGRVMRL